MRRYWQAAVLLAALAGVGGCAGYLIVATSDPATKLSDAEVLFDRRNRPLPAERLIHEAIDIYQKRDDRVGLAKAYVAYGRFFLSPGVANNAYIYRQRGFLDTSVTFDSIDAASLDYLKRAAEILDGTDNYDVLTGVYFYMGWAYRALKQREATCHAFDQSLAASQANLRLHPEAHPFVPPAFHSVAEGLAAAKQYAGCTFVDAQKADSAPTDPVR
jgi:hypothetical protein